MRLRRLSATVLMAGLVGCTAKPPEPPPLTRVSAEDHSFFPIAASLDGGHSMGKGSPADGPVTCDSCHTNPATFTEVSCRACHTHDPAINDMLHRGLRADAGSNQLDVTLTLALDPATAADRASRSCLTCHPKGDEVPYDHANIVTGECATCHQVMTPFAALPIEGFTHREVSGIDCGGCHVTRSWKEVSAAPDGVFDPAKNLIIDVGIPSFSGASIVSVTAQTQELQFTMKHSSKEIDAGLIGNCALCHSEAASNQYYPALLHSSLASLGAPQPKLCADCHSQPDLFGIGARPVGFVGPIATNPVRSPPSAEMRHEATEWLEDGGTRAGLVTADCSTCHFAPGQLSVTWDTSPDGGIHFHQSLTAAGLAQPSS
jgi:hypothetical protein